MVAIKDMKMPTCCSQCNLCNEDKYADMTCALLGSDWEESDYNENHRDDNCPLVEIEERKTGKWIDYWGDKTEPDGKTWWSGCKCSECGTFVKYHYNCCPNCGSINERK